jgi:hypothetical protein
MVLRVPAAEAEVQIKLVTGTCPVPRAAAAETPWGVVLAAAVVTMVRAHARAAAAVPPVWARAAAVDEGGKEK